MSIIDEVIQVHVPNDISDKKKRSIENRYNSLGLRFVIIEVNEDATGYEAKEIILDEIGEE